MLESGIKDLMYSANSDRLYLTVKTNKNIYNLYRIPINKGFLVQNETTMIGTVNDTKIKFAYMTVSPKYIAVYDSPGTNLYVFNIQN